MTQYIYYIWFFLILSTIGYSQIYVDNFEGDNLDNWKFYYRIFQSQDEWQLINDLGMVTIDNDTVFSGNGSLYLAPSNINTFIKGIEKTNKYDFGLYYWYVFITRNNSTNESTDAHFYFKYYDETLYYKVTIYPNYSDNPGISLRKCVSGIETELIKVNTNVNFDKWYKLEVFHDDGGRIIVKTIDTETLNELTSIDVIDNDVRKDGYVGVGCFSPYVHFDDIGFDNNATNVETQLSKCIKLFPNPVKDIVYVSNCKADSYYSIADVNGRIIKTGNLLENSANIQSLDYGIYFITVSETNTKTLRFVKGL
jgi:hypothetical protein